jgi:outer membrane protein
MSSTRFLLFAALFCVLATGTARAQQVKIGVFDPTKIVADSKQGQALQEDLNRFRIQREADIKKERDALKRLLDQYKAGVDTMSQERREEIEADLTARRRDFERLARDADADLQLKRQKGVRELETSVAAVLDGYAKDNGFTLILQRDICAFAVPSIDISGDIVRLVDARTP